MKHPEQAPAALAFDAGPLRNAARWRVPELVFWLLPVAAYFVFPEDLSLLSQIVITALFALSLDLILGYAGIVSLGHAAFFGIGAYAAGLLARNGWGDPLLGLDPEFPVKYIVYFLIVVAVGGSGNIKGSLYASLLLGICDVAGKYYVPQVGAFVIYGVMVATLIFRPQGLFGRAAAK